MDWRNLHADLPWRLSWAISSARRSVRLYWYHTNKAAWLFAGFFALILFVLGWGLEAVVSYREDQRKRMLEFHAKSVACLARNVYYEARGEPLSGQFAVAEVTMNRKASRLFPKTVCEVVYQKTWDAGRRRYVGAFSWTEFEKLDEPAGETWQRAQAIAATVYYHKHSPVVHGALFFHAVHIRPDWARERKRIGRIGKHIFYR
jgi:N-acetylmuramoyl-L-alanine amidase